MRRITFVLVSALLLIGTFLAARGALAQDNGSADYSDHPLVGSWVLTLDPVFESTVPSLTYFAADGGFIEVDPDGSNGLGTWEPTGDSTANLTFHFVDDEEGLTTIYVSIEVSPDGQSFTAMFTLEFMDPESGESSGQVGPGTAEGTRIVAEGPGTPVASFDEVFAEGSPEATPAD